jgi:hypothetical protein
MGIGVDVSVSYSSICVLLSLTNFNYECFSHSTSNNVENDVEKVFGARLSEEGSHFQSGLESIYPHSLTLIIVEAMRHLIERRMERLRREAEEFVGGCEVDVYVPDDDMDGFIYFASLTLTSKSLEEAPSNLQ